MFQELGSSRGPDLRAIFRCHQPAWHLRIRTFPGSNETASAARRPAEAVLTENKVERIAGRLF
jgi:hypothetical protein